MDGRHYSASDSGHIEVVKLLPESGADVTVASSGRWTPIFYAARNGYASLLDLLLIDKRIHPECNNRCNSTPLSIAVRNGHAETVELLVENAQRKRITISENNLLIDATTIQNPLLELRSSW